MKSESIVLDLGSGLTAELRLLDGELMGVELIHKAASGGKCSGGAWLPVTGPDRWELVSRDPLTLSPSILCRGCGLHGFIREGKWVPA